VNQPIINFIPQRPPMVMIDTLIQSTDKTATTSLTILPSNIFVEDNYLRESGLIENIAQTAAAMVGHECMVRNVPVPVGFIAAVKDLKINALPQVNSTIQTSITVTNMVMDITIVHGKIEQSGNLLCSCEMRILVQKTEVAKN
jgi:predicted hotdog family 3-hydroxylacyl-ACP dehydratase